MTWNDDSWKDGYDAWKLASPHDDYEEEDPCDHEDAETDCLDGRVYCHRCGAQWYATAEELAAEHRRVVEYAKWEERENRRQWWRDLFAPILDPIDSLRWKLRRLSWRWRRAPIIDDDIPF